MGPVDLLILLVIAAICGTIAQTLAGHSKIGCLASIALGFIGALLGTWLAQKAGLPELFSLSVGGKQFPIIWSIIGASLFVAVLNFLSGFGKRGRRRRNDD